MATGIVLLIAFVAIEMKSRNPMMPLDVFRSRDFTGANVVTLLLYFGMSGIFFFLPFTLIRAHDISATKLARRSCRCRSLLVCCRASPAD